MHQRVQRWRGKALPPNTKSVARPSTWGNPYVWLPSHMAPGRVRVADVAEAVDRFAADVAAREHLAPPYDLATWLAPLRGHDVACYCAPHEPCHGDVVAEALTRLWPDG